MTCAAVIGLGRVGYDFGVDKNRPQPASHFHCYLNIPNVTKIIVCDVDQEKVSSAVHVYPDFTNKIIHGCFTVKEMLKMKPEIVSICTPTGTHKDIVLAVAQCPSVQTIFLEKPIAQSLIEADEIIRVCNENKKRLAVNYSRRWSKNYAKIRRDLVLPVNLIGMHPGPLIRTGTHMIDLFNWLIGALPDWDKVEVQAFGDVKLASYMNGTDDFNINGYIKYGTSNAILAGNVQSIPSNAVVFELTVWNKDMEVKVTENGCQTEIYMLSESKRYTNLNEYKRCFLSEEEPENLLLRAIDQLTHNMIYQTYDAGCSGLDARRDLQVALALHYSATHDNKKVKLSDVPYEYTVRSY